MEALTEVRAKPRSINLQHTPLDMKAVQALTDWKDSVHGHHHGTDGLVRLYVDGTVLPWEMSSWTSYVYEGRDEKPDCLDAAEMKALYAAFNSRSGSSKSEQFGMEDGQYGRSHGGVQTGWHDPLCLPALKAIRDSSLLQDEPRGQTPEEKYKPEGAAPLKSAAVTDDAPPPSPASVRDAEAPPSPPTLDPQNLPDIPAGGGSRRSLPSDILDDEAAVGGEQELLPGQLAPGDESDDSA